MQILNDPTYRHLRKELQSEYLSKVQHASSMQILMKWSYLDVVGPACRYLMITHTSTIDISESNPSPDVSLRSSMQTLNDHMTYLDYRHLWKEPQSGCLSEVQKVSSDDRNSFHGMNLTYQLRLPPHFDLLLQYRNHVCNCDRGQTSSHAQPMVYITFN